MAVLAGVWLAVALRAAAQAPAPTDLPLPPGPNAPVVQTAATEATEPIVENITLQIQGSQQISTDSVLAHVFIREQMPYDQTLVDKSVDSLVATKQFSFVRTDRQNLPDGNVKLVINLFPNPKVSAVVFKGNKDYSQTRLFEEIKTVAGDFVDEEQLKEDQDKLRDFYQKKGYSQVKVSYAIDTNPNTGTAVVTFQIDEGPAVEIEAINFIGNDHLKAGALADQMQTVTHKFIISWFSGGGIFKREDFLDDLDALRKYYKSHGYLDVDIPEDEVRYDYPAPGELVLTITVHEGRQYRIGQNITIEGNTIFQTATLKALLTLKPGQVFSPEEVDKNRDAIRDFYGKAGYLDTFVTAVRQPDLATGDIGINFMVMHAEGQNAAEGESDKFYVEGIDIEGNTKTRSDVIVRELVLAPGDVFDTDRMKISEDRLRNTGYFDEVNLSPGDTNIPGKRNLRINLTEAKTLTAQIGAGFDPIEGIAAFVDFQETNFDLFNSRTDFRGGGQKAHLRATIGSNILSVQMDYEYPWLWERRLDTGISLFHTEESYTSSIYNEEDTGFTVFVRKPVIEYIDATLSYTLEDILIKDITTAAPPPVFAEKGFATVSKVGLDLVRQEGLDSLQAPTTGQREEFITAVAGGPLGGQTNIYRLEGHLSFWVPTFKESNQVFSMSMRAGTVSGYDGKDVPYAERYFLGGDYDLRGYSYRNVGPKVVDPNSLAVGEPLGGDSMAMVQTEYSFELFKDFRLAFFHDIGFVNPNAYDMSPGGYRQDVGIGLHFFLMKQPIRIDFGFPLNPDQFQSHSITPSFSFQAVY
jgi:outer membrane protein insertion porin family